MSPIAEIMTRLKGQLHSFSLSRKRKNRGGKMRELKKWDLMTTSVVGVKCPSFKVGVNYDVKDTHWLVILASPMMIFVGTSTTKIDCIGP